MFIVSIFFFIPEIWFIYVEKDNRKYSLNTSERVLILGNFVMGIFSVISSVILIGIDICNRFKLTKVLHDFTVIDKEERYKFCIATRSY